MKQQIARLSAHQNGKVFAVLMAVTSLVFILPFFFILSVFAPGEGRPPMFMLLILPVAYLVMGYITVALGCLIYNIVTPFIGGIEYDAKSVEP